MNATQIQNVKTAEILLSDRRGIYIPLHFAEGFKIGEGGWQGIDAEDLETIQEGPETEYYWEAWDSILNKAFFVDQNGLRWTLFQDGDLWVIPDMPVGWLGVGEMSGDIDALEAIADTLAEGRKHRLEGRIQRAAIFEASAESALNCADEYPADLLMTVWEGSLEDHPFLVEEWEQARTGQLETDEEF